ncbi:DUF1947 domain-containing protein [Candidatus Woesearchaeota archaeon]|nr:DUF1947 domain-containing protein [Candidatus Woesearchaeota archaeon]
MHRQLNKKEIKDINDQLQLLLYQFDKNQNIAQEDNVLIADGVPSFFQKDGRWVPLLRLLLKTQILKTITIDMPAVPYIANGADVMRPGIVAFDSLLKKDDLVAVLDQNHKRPIAVGIALFSAEELASIASGKAVKNIHYIGDKLWKASEVTAE